KKTKEVLWNSSQNLCGEKNRWVKPFPESPGQTIPETGGSNVSEIFMKGGKGFRNSTRCKRALTGIIKQLKITSIYKK
ncbi:MAG: hypothetical protein ACK5ZY_06950, partial [Cyclobacteriaceae bacterium]